MEPDIVISHWLYLKLELVRRKHQPGVSLGEMFRIVRKMIAPAASAPELGFARRVQLIGWAIASAVLPYAASQYVMTLGLDVAPENKLARAMRRL